MTGMRLLRLFLPVSVLFNLAAAQAVARPGTLPGRTVGLPADRPLPWVGALGKSAVSVLALGLLSAGASPPAWWLLDSGDLILSVV